MLSLSVFPLPFRVLSSPSVTPPATQPSASSCPHFPAPPHSGLSGATLPLTLPGLSPFFPAWFPMLSFPVLVLGFLFVSFRSSLLRSHSRSTGASLLFRFRFSSGLFRLPSASFRLLRPASDYSAFRLSFPLFPISPDGGSLGASFLIRPACFHAFLPIPVLSFLQFLSPSAVLPHSGYPSASAFRLLLRLLPLGFRFRFGLLGFVVSGFGSPQRPDIY